MVGAADAMLKAADVHMISMRKLGGFVYSDYPGCRGRCRWQAGMQQALQIGELNAVAVIPRPLDDLEQNLPWPVALEEQTLVDTVKNQEKGRGSRAVTIKNQRKGRGSRADNTARFNKVTLSNQNE